MGISLHPCLEPKGPSNGKSWTGDSRFGLMCSFQNHVLLQGQESTSVKYFNAYYLKWDCSWPLLNNKLYLRARKLKVFSTTLICSPVEAWNFQSTSFNIITDLGVYIANMLHIYRNPYNYCNGSQIATVPSPIPGFSWEVVATLESIPAMLRQRVLNKTLE